MSCAEWGLSFQSNCTILDEQKLWHRQLGHPSKQIMSLILGVKSGFGNGGIRDSCDICFWAKQTREVFRKSHSNVDDCFSLIHCDLWGAY